MQHLANMDTIYLKITASYVKNLQISVTSKMNELIFEANRDPPIARHYLKKISSR